MGGGGFGCCGFGVGSMGGVGCVGSSVGIGGVGGCCVWFVGWFFWCVFVVVQGLVGFDGFSLGMGVVGFGGWCFVDGGVFGGS